MGWAYVRILRTRCELVCAIVRIVNKLPTKELVKGAIFNSRAYRVGDRCVPTTIDILVT